MHGAGGSELVELDGVHVRVNAAVLSPVGDVGGDSSGPPIAACTMPSSIKKPVWPSFFGRYRRRLRISPSRAAPNFSMVRLLVLVSGRLSWKMRTMTAVVRLL